MADAAVISLQRILLGLQNCPHIMLHPLRHVQFLYGFLNDLEDYLFDLQCGAWSTFGDRTINRRHFKALDAEIKAAAWRLEDVLESHVSNQVLSRSEEASRRIVVDMDRIEPEINSFAESVRKAKEDYYAYPSRTDDDDDEDDDDDDNEESRRIGLGGKMIGLSDIYSTVINDLTRQWPSQRRPDDLAVSLVGMAGIGKTALAKEIFNDPLIWSYFDCRAWVAVGRKRRVDRVLRCIIAQLNPDVTDEIHGEINEELLGVYLSESLADKRYLIVLDDLWDGYVTRVLRDSLPDGNGGRLLITTRVEEAAPRGSVHNMRFMSKDESWYLLREKVFGEESCPHRLERPGRKIAENCEGLPLLIVAVARILSESEKSPEFWHNVATKESSVLSDASQRISSILYPSYEYMRENSKGFFLYMGVFPQNYEITFSKLIRMWSADGILSPQIYETAEGLATEYLEQLVSRSLVVVRQTRTGNGTETYTLHSVFWHLCKRIGGESKFFHVLNCYADGFGEGIKGQRRLCIHNNILLGIKDVHKSIETISTARSLLCYGAPQQYPVPICSRLRLLRVLDALTIRFYEFPLEVLDLVHLRYLALTCDDNLPRLISKLWSLRFLIIRRNSNIKSSGHVSYLPVEIWDMKELKHLHVTGRDLPDPSGAGLPIEPDPYDVCLPIEPDPYDVCLPVPQDRCGASLPNLSIVLDVGPHSCTKAVLEGLPKLEKLGIRIELPPDGADEPLSCFDHLSRLHGLESLKCVVVNPDFEFRVLARRDSGWVFPERLKRLTLSGLGYPWEGMRAIASLPELEGLKLRCYAFRGPDWVVGEGEFLKLKFLLIEDSDMVNWRAGDGCFPALERLIVKHCYVLKGLPLRDWDTRSLRKIEIVDSNPSVEASAKQFQEDQMENLGQSVIDVYVHSSWKAMNLKP